MDQFADPAWALAVQHGFIAINTLLLLLLAVVQHRQHGSITRKVDRMDRRMNGASNEGEPQ